MADYLREDERGCGEYAEDGRYLAPRLQQRLADARRVLALLEWSNHDKDGDRMCPACGFYERFIFNGTATQAHAPDCALAAALEGIER